MSFAVSFSSRFIDLYIYTKSISYIALPMSAMEANYLYTTVASVDVLCRLLCSPAVASTLRILLIWVQKQDGFIHALHCLH